MASERERYRGQLEQQLRADVELLVAAYRAKLRAYDTLAGLGGGLPEAVSWPPPEVSLGPLTAAGLAPSPHAAQPVPAAAAEPRKRYKPWEIQNAVHQALGRVGELFDKDDLARAMGFTPHRASLHRILLELETNGAITVARRGMGQTPTQYRKLAPAASAQDTSNGN